MHTNCLCSLEPVLSKLCTLSSQGYHAYVNTNAICKVSKVSWHWIMFALGQQILDRFRPFIKRLSTDVWKQICVPLACFCRIVMAVMWRTQFVLMVQWTMSVSMTFSNLKLSFIVTQCYSLVSLFPTFFQIVFITYWLHARVFKNSHEAFTAQYWLAG